MSESGGNTNNKSMLQRRFLLGVGVIFLCFSILTSLVMYFYEKDALEETAHAKSRLVMAVMEANRSYIQEVLRPRMYELMGKDSFILEAMSTSFVSRAVMERFKISLPEYSYRRVSQNARNPVSEPTRLETDLIAYFASHPDEQSRRGIVPIDGTPHFVHARPVRFDDSCMHCHGNPDEAPKALVEKYGRDRGFGYEPGAVSGLMAVTIPVDVALVKIKGRAISMFAGSLIAFAALYIIVCFFFNRVVIHNLRDLLQLFRRSLRDESEFQLLRTATAKDEISEMTAAAETMARHLQQARNQLEEYTKTLEVKVEKRTGALLESKRLLKEKEEKTRESLKLLTMIAELTTRSTDASEIFPNVLRQTLSTVPAKGGALYLLLENPFRLEMQWSENAPSLPRTVEVDPEQFRAAPSEQEKSPLCERFLERLRAPSLLDSHNDLAVPLCCRGRVLGMLVFTEINFEAVTPEIQDMLLSTGQQVGITIESLQNTERLRRSSELLQTVFDGITDMLVLLDRDLCIRMVNRAHIRRFGSGTDGKGKDTGCRSPDACAACPFGRCGVEAVFRSRRPMIEELVDREGDIYLVHYYPILDEKGEVGSIVRYAKDITAQKRVDQKIQQTEKLAAVGQLAAGIAHEINNPLGVILCHTELLDQQLNGMADARNDLATIEKHAMTCQRIVSDLLKFARSKGSSWQLAPINRTIEEVVAMILHQFRRQQVEIHLDLAPDIPLMNLDVDKFKQVCMNLLINARQAIQGKGEVRVITRYLEAEKCAQILFQDNGCGIAPEIMDKIFDPFFTTKKTGE
ncbi:MAG: DUF3365 domain-containing protein, partial [Desulfobacteraceae bacterium]